jgi:hypothetical protein
MTAVLEDAKQFVIDKWGTLNTAASPARLPDGHSPRNQNVWMDEKPGSIVTANGYTKLGDIPSGPATLLLNFFKTSDGSSQLIVSNNESIWWTTDYVNYTVIKSGLSAFFQLRAKVIRDKVWFTNGSDDVATWDGTNYVQLNGSGLTPDVPTGKYIEYHDERVWIYGIASDLSSCRFSALADSSGTEIAPDNASAWPADNELQISEGDADQGTGIFVYRGFLFCSKQYSIWRITGYDEDTYTRTKTRSSTGTRFQESIQINDNLVHFIGVDGLYTFDGEDATRISDIIDTGSTEDGVFSFRNLQQPLLSSKFWNVSEEADFDTGTVPANLTTGDNLTLAPADDTETDFNAGTKDDVVAISGAGSAGFLELDLVTSGSPGSLISVGKTASASGAGSSVIGSTTYFTDGNTSNQVGLLVGGGSFVSCEFRIDLGSVMSIGRMVAKDLALSHVAPFATGRMDNTGFQVSTDGSSWTDAGSELFPDGTTDFSATTYTKDFTTVSARYVRLFFHSYNGSRIVCTEIEVYSAGYEPDGKFTSRALDYGFVPRTYGTLIAFIEANGEAYQFFTQSSSDGSTWDAEVNLTSGQEITSTVKRYLRWGAYLYSSTGVSTPLIDKVYVGGTYLSEIHDTGGNILQWAAIQVPMDRGGHTIRVYFRAASTSGGVSAESWTEIAPGAVPSTAITNTFIQIKIEFSQENPNEQHPTVEGFTVNWVLSSSSGASVLQNVASFVWLNRYWLSAATLSADNNDIVIVRGKSTFDSPWHTKDFALLTFCRFQDIFIAGSSVDGSLYQLETGYSKNGSAMDSYYETKDFSEDNFFLKGRELLVQTDRSGPYNLTVGYSVDSGLNWTDKSIDLTRETGESLSFTKRLNISYMRDQVRFRVRINAADQPFSVDSITEYHRTSPQRGSIL